MAGFKKGAFSVAVKAGVDVVPITLLGTGNKGWAIEREHISSRKGRCSTCAG